jgi:catechol 2,3-dioxygenase-like lactoylglutathione lyase family enzyme
VDDLSAFLAQLEADGIAIEKVEEFDYGRFAWVRDPDGNRIELYEQLAPVTTS